MSPTNNNQRIAKNSLFMTIRMILVIIITFYTSRIVLEVLGVVDYGVYNVVAGFVSMFAFMSSSLSAGIQRFHNFELGKNGILGAQCVFNAALLIQIVFSILLVAIIEPIGLWYLHNKMVLPLERMWAAEWVFQMAIITLITHIIQVPFSAAVMAHEKMAFYAILNVLSAIVTLLGVGLIRVMDIDALVAYSFIVMIVAILSLVAYIIYSSILFPEIRITPKCINQSLLKEMLSFSCWNIFGTFGHMLKDQGVNLILNFYFGPVVNAARGVAMQINSALQNFVTNITVPARPQTIQAYSQGNKVRSYNLTYTISKISFVILLLIALPVILEIDYLLNIWLGHDVPSYTAAFSSIIILDSLVLTLNSPISALVHASGIMKNYQLFGGSMSIIAIICSYIAIITLKEPIWAFISILLVDIVRQCGAVMIVKKIEHGNFSVHSYLINVLIPVLKILLLSTPIPIVLHQIIEYGFIRVLCVFICSCVIVTIVTYTIGLNSQEKNMIEQLVVKIFNKNR